MYIQPHRVNRGKGKWLFYLGSDLGVSQNCQSCYYISSTHTSRESVAGPKMIAQWCFHMWQIFFFLTFSKIMQLARNPFPYCCMKCRQKCKSVARPPNPHRAHENCKNVAKTHPFPLEPMKIVSVARPPNPHRAHENCKNVARPTIPLRAHEI